MLWFLVWFSFFNFYVLSFDKIKMNIRISCLVTSRDKDKYRREWKAGTVDWAVGGSTSPPRRPTSLMRRSDAGGRTRTTSAPWCGMNDGETPLLLLLLLQTATSRESLRHEQDHLFLSGRMDSGRSAVPKLYCRSAGHSWSQRSRLGGACRVTSAASGLCIIRWSMTCCWPTSPAHITGSPTS